MVIAGDWAGGLELKVLNLLLKLTNYLETKGSCPRLAFLAPTPLPAVRGPVGLPHPPRAGCRPRRRTAGG